MAHESYVVFLQNGLENMIFDEGDFLLNVRPPI